MSTHDPFDDLASPPERQQPRPSFARDLRRRVRAELGLDDDPPPTIRLPERKSTMTTATATAAPSATGATAYLTVHDAAAAIDFYVGAFGAVEQMRVVGDDGRIGHADLTIGTVTVFLADEYPEMDILSPITLGGTGAGIMLHVGDVDSLHTRAVAAGATSQREPEDQDHGNRVATVIDPFGHRWMLSQHVEDVDAETYRERLEESEYHLAGSPEHAYDIPGLHDGEQIPVASRPGTGGGIWAGAFYRDALAGIRFLVDVFGFEEQLVVVGDDGETVVHSQLRWPEGGIVQAGTYSPDRAHHRGYADADDDPFVHAPGQQSLYVVTADPRSVWERCVVAGCEVVRPPEEPDHAPGTMGFTVRDPEGNVWSFGQYGLDA